MSDLDFETNLFSEFDRLRRQHADAREPHFAHTFTLSPDFDTARVEARIHDGVPKLTIPRRDEARPRRIEVKST